MVFAAGSQRPVGRLIGRTKAGELLVAGPDRRARRVPAPLIQSEEPGRVTLTGAACRLERCPGYLPDAELEEAVRTSLGSWSPLSNLGLTGIEIRAQDGRVTLAGHVPTETFRHRAHELARRTWGVLTVEDRLVSDERLVADVTARLARHEELQPSRVRVSSYLGGVTLTGEVRATDHAELACREAQAVPGVRGVRNLLEIVPNPG
jgi:osmotically-inducible protein OsmY